MTVERVRLKTATPVLCVRDIPQTRDHLVDRLGFQLFGQVGDPPTWASLGRDGCELMLLGDPDHPPPAPDWTAYVYLDDDVDALHAELTGRGAAVICAPEDKPYNLREFSVRLPDGRLLGFGGPIKPEGAHG